MLLAEKRKQLEETKTTQPEPKAISEQSQDKDFAAEERKSESGNDDCISLCIDTRRGQGVE